MDKMDKHTPKGMKLPGESDEQCCFCIPIKIGVTVIGIVMIISAVQGILAGLHWLSLDFIFGVLMICAFLPVLLGAWWFIAYFRDMENADTRGNLVKACMMVIFS